jgi:hypothetical protein
MRTIPNLTTSTPESDRFLHYSLFGLIPETSVFIVDTVNFSLNLVNLLPENVPDLREQRIVTPIEMSLILELLAQFPNYCPFENLLQAHEGLTIERQRERLLRALNENNTEPVLRPLRNCISRCRQKLHPFGLEISDVSRTGYWLVQDGHRF